MGADEPRDPHGCASKPRNTTFRLLAGVLIIGLLQSPRYTNADAPASHAVDPARGVIIGDDYASISKADARIEEQPCDPWLLQYAAFHNANKHSTSAKYLIYQCSQDSNEAGGPLYQGCNGLGDRLRGIMFMMRIAHATSRILLVNHTVPVDMAAGFVPTFFDWRVGNLTAPCDVMQHPCTGTDLSGRAVSSEYWSSSGYWRPFPEWMVNGSMLNGTMSHITHMYMTMVYTPDFPLPSWVTPFPDFHVNRHINVRSKHCLFSALFQASSAVETRVDEFVKELGLPRSPSGVLQYLALHLRIGVDGHESDQKRHTAHEQNATIPCARQLAKQHNLSSIVVAVDSLKMRKDIISGAYPGFQSIDIHPSHIHIVKHNDTKLVETFVDTVSEFVMLARASCLIMSTSGFGETAMMMGGNKCYSDIHHCWSIYKPVV